MLQRRRLLLRSLPLMNRRIKRGIPEKMKRTSFPFWSALQITMNISITAELCTLFVFCIMRCTIRIKNTICIQDTGIGIAQEEQQRIFKSFEQLGSNYSKSQGTGLGLAISKNIIQLMGGELQLKSELDQGSEFYFTITCPKGQLDKKPELEGKAGAEIVRGAKILLAEDNHLNAEIAMELLRSQGATVRWAENGKAVLEMFSQSKPGDVDVILMDVQMPEMNGLEATRAIRALSRPDAKSVPILAMTANAFKEDEKAALDAGMNDFIPKPIDVKTMYQKLYRALHSSCES